MRQKAWKFPFSLMRSIWIMSIGRGGSFLIREMSLRGSAPVSLPAYLRAGGQCVTSCCVQVSQPSFPPLSATHLQKGLVPRWIWKWLYFDWFKNNAVSSHLVTVRQITDYIYFLFSFIEYHWLFELSNSFWSDWREQGILLASHLDHSHGQRETESPKWSAVAVMGCHYPIVFCCITGWAFYKENVAGGGWNLIHRL